MRRKTSTRPAARATCSPSKQVEGPAAAAAQSGRLSLLRAGDRLVALAPPGAAEAEDTADWYFAKVVVGERVGEQGWVPASCIEIVPSL